ncbi:MAG: hypothetical protein HC904_01200 [Blastochloris sp.]|nr:hypothetical protein [Blastochloris sp.]
MRRIASILLNLLAFPGTGTMLSGRIMLGLLQLCLALLGFGLSLWGTVDLAKLVFTTNRELLSTAEIQENILNAQILSLEQFLLALGIAILGVFLFSIAWIWAALSSLCRSSPPPLPSQP